MNLETKNYEWDTDVPEHASDLYDFVSTANGINGFESIDFEAIRQYEENGFLVINEAFTAEEIQNATQGLIDLIDGKNPDFSIIQFRREVMDRIESLTLEEKLRNVRKIGTFVEYDRRLKQIAEHPELLNLVSTLLAAESELYQSMALIKPPHGREKPWHQDHAYFDLPIETKVVGVWIALDEATPENGCMRVLPRWHRKGTFPHFMVRDWQLCDDQSERFKPETIAVSLKPGGALIFDSFLPHGTPSNHSQLSRKALQFHYFPKGIQRRPQEERLAIWGSEGKDVQC